MMRKVLVTMLLAFLPGACVAQNESATLSGRISDPTGAAIVGAEVVLTNVDTNVEQRTRTNSAGLYVFTGVHPGAYRVAAGSPGFKTLIKENLTLHVQDELAENFSLPLGAMAETVTVNANDLHINTTDAAVSTVIDRQFVESLPLNGRSFNTLLQLTPGVVLSSLSSSPLAPGQFSIGGQRTDANNFTVDGVSANFGVNSSGLIGQSGTGTAQAFSVLGSTSSLVSVEALQEFRVETSSFAPEFGRTPGGQVTLSTRSGTNSFHGGLYEYFRNDVMDAGDWFANQSGQPRPAERHNDFGGYVGGPIWKNKTFFFASYEGARLRVPVTDVLQVPSACARSGGPECPAGNQSAPASVAPYLNAYPQPNGPAPVDSCNANTPDGCVQQFTGSFSNSATLNAGSIRIDHNFNDHFSIFGRYNEAPSDGTRRFPSQFNQVELVSDTVNTRTATIGFNAIKNSQLADTFRANYSMQQSTSARTLDSWGGSVPLPFELLGGALPSADTSGAFQTFDTGYYSTGPSGRNTVHQMNFVDDLFFTVGTHATKYGVDYRAIYLHSNPSRNGFTYESPSVQEFICTPDQSGNCQAGLVSIQVSSAVPAHVRSRAFSFYAQDSWKASKRLTLTYGVRWELDPAPEGQHGTQLAAWTDVDNPALLALAPTGTPLWHTTYGNFAPRLGAAYALTDKGDFVLRAGGGIFYDLGVGSAADLTSTFPNFVLGFANGQVPLMDPAANLPSLSTNAPYPYVEAFTPNLKLPRSFQWNVALEKSLWGRQAITVTYVGQAGRKLLRQAANFQPNANFASEFVLTENDARSNYNALQVQYRRPLSAGLQAILNYTWSHALDNASDDVVTGLANTVISAANDYASSSNDARHSFSGALTYELPGVKKSRPLWLLTKGWSVDAVIVARTGFPFNAAEFSVSPDPGGFALTRPDRVAGQPAWVSTPGAPGGKILNVNAFAAPTTNRQGTEGRNDIYGFGLTQVDLSLARKFSITERVGLQFRADAFNVLNHPNFTNPLGYYELGPLFLQSQEMLNQGLGGLNSLFQEGGPRSLQISLKLTF
jgi:hypothetical protein